MSLLQKYKKSLDEKWCMRFKTHHPEGDNFDGVITHIKPSFIVLCEEEDFEFDGVVILPKKNIKGYRNDKHDACCNEILQNNGQIKKLRTPRWLDSCESLNQVIEMLMRKNIWAVVETIFYQGKKTAFYLGPITKVGEDDFYLYCYDAAGKWEKEYAITYKEIFKIEFDSKYCNHFNSYMKNKPMK